ncbi:MAG: DUF177 domain-containing protein [Quisquiliibacterium sp.]
MNLQAEVSVRCERCLQPMAISVQEDRLFKLVSTEKEAEREDREADDHDVLVGKTRFDVLELVQDELIMALPIAPRHADCQLPQVNLKAGAKTRRAAGDEQAPERDSPFAVLARLKRPGSRDDGAG